MHYLACVKHWLHNCSSFYYSYFWILFSFDKVSQGWTYITLDQNLKLEKNGIKWNYDISQMFGSATSIFSCKCIALNAFISKEERLKWSKSPSQKSRKGRSNKANRKK